MKSFSQFLPYTNSTPAAPARTPATPIFLYATAAAPVLCGLAPVELFPALPLTGVDTVLLLCVVLARLTLNVEASETDSADVLATREGPGCCEEAGRRASVDAAAVALLSTVNGSPHVTDCEDVRPRRERRVVLRRVDDFILIDMNDKAVREFDVYDDLISTTRSVGFL